MKAKTLILALMLATGAIAQTTTAPAAKPSETKKSGCCAEMKSKEGGCCGESGGCCGKSSDSKSGETAGAMCARKPMKDKEAQKPVTPPETKK
jgi:hypothetical protein